MFKSRCCKLAYRKGIKKGLQSRKKKHPAKKKKKSLPRSGAYTAFGRVNDGRVDDRLGPVVFWDDFDFDSKGRIKGSYVNGRFEPD